MKERGYSDKEIKLISYENYHNLLKKNYEINMLYPFQGELITKPTPFCYGNKKQ